MHRPAATLVLALTAALVATPTMATVHGAAPAPGRAAALASAFWPGVLEVTGTELATLDFGPEPAALDGAVVVASLWPALEERAAVRPGETFHLTPVDRVTMVDGTASVHVADAAMLRAHQSGSGAVVLHLDVFTADGMTVFVNERVRTRAGTWVESAAPDGGPTISLTLDPSRVEKLTLPPAQRAARPLVKRNHEGVLQCSEMTADPAVTATETIQVAGVYRGIQAAFTYTSSASTASGMGVQIGTGAAWSQSSLASRTSTLTAEYAPQTGSSTTWSYREWKTNWLHLRYWRHCPNTPDTGYHTQRFTEPYKVNGFPAIATSRYPDVPCAARNVLTGVSSIQTDDTTAMQYDQGFSITYGGATFRGSARSDFTAAVRMKFIRPAAVSGYWYWCGDNVVAQDSYWVKAGR